MIDIFNFFKWQCAGNLFSSTSSSSFSCELACVKCQKILENMKSKLIAIREHSVRINDKLCEWFNNFIFINVQNNLIKDHLIIRTAVYLVCLNANEYNFRICLVSDNWLHFNSKQQSTLFYTLSKYERNKKNIENHTNMNWNCMRQ